MSCSFLLSFPRRSDELFRLVFALGATATTAEGQSDVGPLEGPTLGQFNRLSNE